MLSSCRRVGINRVRFGGVTLRIRSKGTVTRTGAQRSPLFTNDWIPQAEQEEDEEALEGIEGDEQNIGDVILEKGEVSCCPREAEYDEHREPDLHAFGCLPSFFLARLPNSSAESSRMTESIDHRDEYSDVGE